MESATRDTVFQGRILGLSVYEGVVEGRRVKREIIEHPGAAAMLAFDEDGMVIMVNQYRFPRGRVLEIPAGTLEKGESPRECALRELQEETGYAADNMEPLLAYYPSIGYNTEKIHCFVATGLRRVSGAHPDEDEIISVEPPQGGGSHGHDQARPDRGLQDHLCPAGLHGGDGRFQVAAAAGQSWMGCTRSATSDQNRPMRSRPYTKSM